MNHRCPKIMERTKRLLICLCIAFLLSAGANSYGFSGAVQDCSKCHVLTKEEAASILKQVIPTAKVLGIRNSQFMSFWEVSVEAGGKKTLVYVDMSKKYLFSGSLLDLKAKRNLTEERLSELNKVNVSTIPLKDALVLGDPNARNRVIVFDDPD